MSKADPPKKDIEAVDDDPPEGFQLSTTRGPFSTNNGPYYHKNAKDTFFHGLRVRKKHCNAHGIMHGGMMMAFADGLLATAVWKETETRTVTVKLNSEFLSMARPGDWVEGTAWVTRATKSVAFAECRVYVGKRTIFLASAIFKLMSKRPT